MHKEARVEKKCRETSEGQNTATCQVQLVYSLVHYLAKSSKTEQLISNSWHNRVYILFTLQSSQNMKEYNYEYATSYSRCIITRKSHTAL